MRQELEWTAKRVQIQLEEAAETLWLLPRVIPKAMLCSWPPFIRDYFELYCDDDALPRRGSATPKAVTEMDEALSWMHWVDPKTAKVLWSRACHIPWRLIAERMGLSRQTVSEYWKQGLEIIAAKLNQESARLWDSSKAAPFVLP